MTPGCMDNTDVEVYKQAFQRPGVATAALNYYRASLGPKDVSPEAEKVGYGYPRVSSSIFDIWPFTKLLTLFHRCQQVGPSLLHSATSRNALNSFLSGDLTMQATVLLQIRVEPCQLL